MAILTPSAFEIDRTLPRVGQAATLALGILKFTRCDTWAELETAVSDTGTRERLAVLRLTPRDKDLLTRYRAVILLLGAKPPLRSVSVCPTCGHIAVVSKTFSAICRGKPGCTGTMVKISAPRRVAMSEVHIAHTR